MISKITFKSLAVLTVALVVLSCKSNDSQPQYPAEILSIISLKQIDALTKLGMEVHNGNNPPSIEGIYITDDADCIGDSGDPQRLGKWRYDYKFRFRNQDNTTRTIELDYKTIPDETVDKASGKGAFIIGEGNNFTVFMQTQGVQDGVTYKYVYVFSGVINPSTKHIVNWYDSLTLTEKGDDPTGKLIDVGVSRVFVEDDGVASSTNSFRIGAETQTKVTGKSAATR